MTEASQLTVEENLLLGLEAQPGGMGRQKRIDPFVYELFPILRDFLTREAATSVAASSSNWRLPGP